MIVLSSLLRRAVYPAMSSAGMFSRRLRAGDVCVLSYHGVAPDRFVSRGSPVDGPLLPAAQFRRQLRFLKSRYELVTPVDFRNWCDGKSTLPHRAVLLTCDDGLLNALTEMVPILREEKVRCLFFVTGASTSDAPAHLWYEELYQMLADAPGDASLSVGESRVRKSLMAKSKLRGYWWSLVQELSALSREQRGVAVASLRAQWRLADDWCMYRPGDAAAERRYRLLNRAELQQLANHGMSIGAHTMSHPVLARAPQNEAEREIVECRTQLESCLNQPVWALAYPFGNDGSAGEREMRIAQEAGYSCAFMNLGGGRLAQTSPRFALPRAHVSAEMGIAELEANLSGFHQKLQHWVRADGGQLPPESLRSA